jgi:ribulose-5-phosphate 4-epimerase/fuculose-1-phosphate aldolase
VREVLPISQESCLFFEDHAVFDDEEVQVQSVEGGKRIAVALGRARAIVLRNHGLLTVGDGVDQAVGRFVHLERVAEVHMKARAAKPISAEAARYAKADLDRIDTGRVAFWSMITRHIEDPTVVH